MSTKVRPHHEKRNMAKMDPKYEAFVENDLKPSKTRAAAQLLLLLAHFLVASFLATVTHIDTCCDDSYRDRDIH